MSAGTEKKSEGCLGDLGDLATEKSWAAANFTRTAPLTDTYAHF